MISKNAANVAISIAQEFDRRRLMLTPVGGTPLATLNTSCDQAAGVVQGEVEYHPDGDLIAAISSGFSDDGQSRHDQELAAFATEIGAAVSNHLNFAKNQVRPVIQELVTEVTKDIEALPTDVQYNLAIVQKGLPEPMVSSAFEDMVAEFAEVNYEEITSYASLPAIPGAQVGELLVTGAADTDAVIAAWAAKMGDAFLEMVWTTAFTNQETEQRFSTMIQDEETGLEAAIVVFLICKRVFDNPPEGTQMPLSAFNSIIADLRNQSALRVSHGYEEHARALRSGLLIRKITPTELVVNAEVYTRWVEAGGIAAVLLGSALSDRPVRYVADLDSRALEFKDQWERTNRILTIAEQNKRFVNYKTILRERTVTVIGNNLKTIFGEVAEGQEISTSLPAYVKAVELVEAFVDTLIEPQFKNLWLLSTQIICRSAFYYTDAEKILIGIDKACNENEGIAVREAALLSTIDYVVDYVCDQMTLTAF